MCDYNPLNKLAGKTRHFNSRLLLAREPPFPAQNPQARPGEKVHLLCCWLQPPPFRQLKQPSFYLMPNETKNAGKELF
jgi:hypothetical protein